MADKEWLITNGIGGFASSSLDLTNTRRYHGLLVASFMPPVDRKLIVSGLQEYIDIKNKQYNLASFECSGGFCYTAKNYITNFEREYFPKWTYNIEDLKLTKEIWMVREQNTTVVSYKIKTSRCKAKINLVPLINYRDYHGERIEFSDFKLSANQTAEILLDKFNNRRLKIICNEGYAFNKDIQTFHNMFYKKESERGLNSVENHYMPGNFVISLKPHEEKEINIIFTTEDKKIDIEKEYKKATNRIDALVQKSEIKDSFGKSLVKAADDFIVYRKSIDGKTILAGYPWFTDWGRDSLIALTGLTITTKRYDDAKSILETFAKYIKDGLIPNVFPDVGEEPAYNTVDAPLWYFYAVYNYIEATKDIEFLEKIYPKLLEIYNRFLRGSVFHNNKEKIYMDNDSLIYAGSKDTQLTWMDAKVGDFIVTPRFGKAVEINALWYNANMVMSHFCKLLGKDDIYIKRARTIKKNFNEIFWNEEDKCLYDVVNEEGIDKSIRPNQIFAISLDFPVVEGSRASCIFDKVARDLYTPVGLRSLSPKDLRYRGIYIGNIWERDTAYHQGTVWAWPLGAFITAAMRLNKQGYSKEKIIKDIEYHLNEEVIGQISEIFDGNEPYTPRGCFAQAWSVGEILRAIED